MSSKQCTQCSTIVAVDEEICASCGNRSFAIASASTQVITDRSIASPSSASDAKGGARRFGITLPALFSQRSRIVIGRAPDCGICLPHPMVSARHAVIERVAEGVRIAPYDSGRSVIVGGERVSEPTVIRDRRRFGIGPFLFTLVDDVLQYLDSTSGLRLEARGLEKVIKTPEGGTRKLLAGVDLVIEPGEFVTLLGPSGSGKSTLMDCLNGRRRATSGHVIANGEDFYQQYHIFRHSLGYVPQKDIVHTQLTVERALRYTAKLRLPKDMHEHELEERVEQVISQMELIPHRATMIGNLSGGQIKRVSLGAELLANPSLLYIDEATSGLDAGTEARMMSLFRQLADDGKSVVCITHNVDNVDRCHLILVLAAGRLVYCGPPHDAPAYFGVTRLGQIYDAIATREINEWVEQFQQTSLYDEFVRRRLAESQIAENAPAAEPITVSTPTGADKPAMTIAADHAPMEKTLEYRAPYRPAPAPSNGADKPNDVVQQHVVQSRSNWYQFRILTRRYIELLIRDKKSFRLLLLQAPIVGLILAVGLVHLKYTRAMPWNEKLSDSQRQMLEYLHQFNVVLSSADHNTIEQDKDLLTRIEFTVKTKIGVHKLHGYDLAKRIQRAKNFGVLSEPTEIVLAANVDENSNDAPKVNLRELVGMAHSMASIEKGHPDLAQELLKMDKGTMPIVPKSEFFLPNGCWSVMFILSITVFWFGCNNAAKEIVKEEAIYARERAAGIAIPPYLLSKFVVLLMGSVMQAAVLLLTIHAALALVGVDLPKAPGSSQCIYFLPLWHQFGIFASLSITGVACGLLISACVANPDRATALTPYVLIPQIVLGGSFIPIEGFTMTVLAWAASPCYWAYRALHHGTSLLPPYFLPQYHAPEYSLAATYIALTVQLVVMLTAAAWFLKKKDASAA